MTARLVSSHSQNYHPNTEEHPMTPTTTTRPTTTRPTTTAPTPQAGPSIPRTMRAAVQSRYGAVPEDVLELADVPVPDISDDDVLIEVRAASVDRGTWHVMAGLPYAMRFAGFGVRRPAAINPGRSVAGVVVRAGSRSLGFRPGDEVYGICEGGSFAEYAAASARKIALKAPTISFEEAAALPVSGITALQAVRDHAAVEAGDDVLVLGASGGVGMFASQIALARGASVTGVCSTGKVAAVRRLGVDRVIDYTVEDPLAGHRYDTILDIGGCSPLGRLRSALVPDGRLVIVGGESDGRLFGVGRQVRALLWSPFVGQRLRSFVTSENSGDLDALRSLVEAGVVSPSVDDVFALDETPRAIRALIDGRVSGKAVISVSGPDSRVWSR